MVTDGNQTYSGDRLIIQRNTESLCYVQTNTVLQFIIIQKTKNLVEKKIRLVVSRDGGLGEGELDESGQKVQTSSCKINKYQGCKVQRDQYNEHSCMLYLKVVKRVNPKGSHHKESTFLLFCIYMR